MGQMRRGSGSGNYCGSTSHHNKHNKTINKKKVKIFFWSAQTHKQINLI